MEAKVSKAFKDKENKKKRYAKDKIFEGSKERVEELQKLGYVVAVNEQEKEPQPEKEEPKSKKKKTEKPKEGE